MKKYELREGILYRVVGKQRFRVQRPRADVLLDGIVLCWRCGAAPAWKPVEGVACRTCLDQLYAEHAAYVATHNKLMYL